MLLLIDNFDSFTHNIARYLRELGAEVRVVRNNAITVAEIEQLAPDQLVISPGPGTPDEAGISLQAVRHFAGKLPILGICLGHQTIAQVFGGKVVRAERVMHGKTSLLQHIDADLFAGLAQPLTVARYHSLLVDSQTLPDELEVTAWTTSETGEVNEIMGLRHRELPISSVQFHPEAIQTQQGHELLANFLKQARSG